MGIDQPRHEQLSGKVVDLHCGPARWQISGQYLRLDGDDLASRDEYVPKPEIIRGIDMGPP